MHFVLHLIIAIYLSYFWFSTLENFYLTRIDYFNRPKIQHDLSLFSENGFYYSFFEQITDANSTKEATNLIFNDKLSEYPDEINAMVILFDF